MNRSPSFNTSPSTPRNISGPAPVISDGAFSKIYRFIIVLVLTTIFCYLLRTILYLALHMVIPVVAIVVCYVFYVNGGLTSSDGYNSSMDNLTSAVRAFLSGAYDIGNGIRNVVTQ